MRLRTLPVSVAGVIAGTACAIDHHGFSWAPALCCLLFAILAQIASNFANEYFDFRNGLDRPGRDGFRRGVTEGDISPGSMLRATMLTLVLAAIPGCALILWGGWWMVPIGIAIGLFALAYSAGPYPLSHHGLGDIAVIIFFGLVPVTLTAWLQTGSAEVIPIALCVGLGIGLLAADVLIVNNYRDMDDDAAVGKRTTVVIFGRKVAAAVYVMFGIAGLLCLCFIGSAWMCVPAAFIPVVVAYGRQLRRRSGSALNPMLGRTAGLLLAASVVILVEVILG